MNRKSEAVAWLIGAIVVGTVAQRMMKQQAAVLGLTAFELALIGAAGSAIVNRTLLA